VNQTKSSCFEKIKQERKKNQNFLNFSDEIELKNMLTKKLFHQNEKSFISDPLVVKVINLLSGTQNKKLSDNAIISI